MLDVTFTPPKDNVNFDTICLVEELYQNLINNVPIKRTERIDSIDCNCESPKEMENKPILFNFETTNNIKLFESNINLPCIIFVFNSIVKFVTEKNGKQKLVLYDEDETNKRYASSMYFKSKDQLILYKKDKANEISKLFRDAKRASDYLI